MQAHEELVRIRPRQDAPLAAGFPITNDRQHCMPSRPRSIGVTITNACTGRNGSEKTPRRPQPGSAPRDSSTDAAECAMRKECGW